MYNVDDKISLCVYEVWHHLEDKLGNRILYKSNGINGLMDWIRLVLDLKLYGNFQDE